MPLQANKTTKSKTKSWHEETSEKERKKIEDISEEKGAPITTKQTVTLTTIAG